MCSTSTDFTKANSKTAWERLSEALNRDIVRQHQWCEDGKIIIDAARKHLETLPKPKRKVKLSQWVWVEMLPARAVTTPFPDKESAEKHRSNFVNPENWQLVELAGEYEE